MSNFNGITEMKSFFIGKYEIKLPIVQGGMGVGVSLNGLASAVANEGGVGVISAAGLGLLYPGYKGSYSEKCIYGLRQEIRKAREKTYGVIGINIMVALSNFPDMVRTAVSENADVIFTDVWASMGQEGEAEQRRAAFAGIYQVNEKLLGAANEGCMVQHCLPAHRGEEITAEVLEAHAAEIFDEAENRLHAQKAVMVALLKE